MSGVEIWRIIGAQHIMQYLQEIQTEIFSKEKIKALKLTIVALFTIWELIDGSVWSAGESVIQQPQGYLRE